MYRDLQQLLKGSINPSSKELPDAGHVIAGKGPGNLVFLLLSVFADRRADL